ncbi:orotidine-monophosphate-decarboxylase, putative [Eimeria necatrix]|uniref:Orotidine 5'-phosphate decarboxylase n=1 Tax=Eimeria necatrix TaxID=51315 RepID=U6MZ17_9EIME|nr:orotidine-monophosphate-decarboxylase, putative [Eimeria necatrix]CDJ69477.1 orotidine-monophosphate-decarboxylase, putative [Eimeria necatrix]
MTCSFLQKLTRRIKEHGTILCVGIDPPLACPTTDDLRGFNRQQLLEDLHEKCVCLIRKTSDFVCCFKPNVAFFEQYGSGGMEVLQRICREIPEDIPIILDAKRAATDEAAEAMASAFYSAYNADCVTLDPYLGEGAILPFIKEKGKGVFVVCRSSNPRSSDLQGFIVVEGFGAAAGKEDGAPVEVFMEVAHMCDRARRQREPELSKEGGLVGIVVGSTYPKDMKRIRSAFPDLWFLSPGIGAQGGDLAATIEAGLRQDGLGLIVNVGRAISEAKDPGKAAEAFRDEMRQIMRKVTL